MYFQFGGYTHPVGQVAISSDARTREYSPRGRLQSIRRRLAISGTIIESGQSDITAAINSLAGGYSNSAQGAGLLQADGAPSGHYLFASGSLYGIRVLDGPNFNDTMGNGEYATGRSFSVTLEAEYPQATADPLLSYSETISVQGTGGPRIAVIETDTGTPVTEVTQARTTVIVRQQGSAVGYLAPVAPNPPLFPAYLSGPDASVTNGSPSKQAPGLNTDYPTSWSYQFVLPEAPGPILPAAR